MPFVLIYLPTDYFTRSTTSAGMGRRRQLLVRLFLLSLKNLVGLAVLIAGVIMLVTPGQGVLTMLVGVSLLDFPGKRALERWLIRNPRVFATINAVRRKAGQPPLEQP